MPAFTALRLKVLHFLERQLPNRTKRLIVLASLFAEISSTEDKRWDKQTLHQLNKLMTLCHTDQALAFPMHLSHAIWRDKEIANVIQSPQEIEIKEKARTLTQYIPKWLKYSESKTIESDIQKLIRNQSSLLST